MRNRRDFIKQIGGVAGALAFAQGGRVSAAPPRQPNIILILADDLGYGDLGCFGQKQIRTPRLDQMAAEGMKLTRHYSGSTVCAPSRCCLMTGLHTGHARIRGNGVVPLQADDVTVATLLRDAGYATALTGKWGLGEAGSTGVPNRQGFDHFFGYLNQVRAHNYYPPFLWRNDTKVELPNEVVYAQKGYAAGVGSAATKRVVYSHDRIVEEALQFVGKQAATRHPFFLYLAVTLPHANNEGALAGPHGMEVPDLGIYKDKDWPDAQKAHAAMITRLDRDVGRLLDLLKEKGIDQDTLVLFTSDNGPHQEGGALPDFFDSNGPLRGIKRDLYEGGIRVPTLARWPGRIAPGSASDHHSAFWDFLPTACEVAGAQPPPNIDGISFLPTLLGKDQPKPDYLYWEFFERGPKQALLFPDDWKAIYFIETDTMELYHLREDIGETHNLADTYPDRVAQARALLKKARTPSAAWQLPPSG